MEPATNGDLNAMRLQTDRTLYEAGRFTGETNMPVSGQWRYERHLDGGQQTK